ncbi:MAG: heparinase II/III domain-containing protein, partial [Mariniphaga sp.]
NWNQVCNGGMIAASIAIAEEEPELAAKTIWRALDGLPHALVEYGPDGVYPEGSTYWSYGTSFSVTTAAMLESAFGTDFGHFEYPAFKESAVFRVLMNAPSGWYYNFADCGDRRSAQGDITLAWFGTKTGNASFFEKERFLMPAEEMGKLSRLAGAALVWIAQYEEKGAEKVPTAWKGEGANPVVIFTGGENDPHQYYFGGKGGRGMVNHGNMDGGSFIFELNGVRWSIDPGNQSYHELEKTGFDLWGRCQTCERWTLLTKNNYGHSTITINDSLHRTEGLVTLTDFKAGDKPEATFDMSATLGDLVAGASRKFVKDSPTSIRIEDEIEINDKTKLITWQLMTTADVEIVDGGAILKQDGQSLRLENLSHPELMVSVVSLDPAPLELDRQIEGLKRLEIRIPAWTVEGGETNIRVRLSGD